MRNLLEGAITAGLVLVLALWVSAAIERKLLSSGSGHDLSLRKIAANIMRALLIFVGLIVALSAVGIDLTALSVLGGAIGVGLGFGLQKIAANYVSGFVILAERSLRIGDMVKVDTFEGRITDIRTRYTVIRSLNGREAIVPNETLITTAGRERLARRSARARADGGAGRLRHRRARAAAEARGRRSPPCRASSPTRRRRCSSPRSRADGMDLAINFWIRDPENGQGNVKSDVNLVVLDVLDREGVEIPFPQRVVHAVASREPGPASDGQVASAGAASPG